MRPHRGHASTSTANVWRNRSGHDHLRAVGGGERSSTVMVRVEAGSRPAAGLDDPGALEPRSIVTTELSRSTSLTTGASIDEGRGDAPVPHVEANGGGSGRERGEGHPRPAAQKGMGRILKRIPSPSVVPRAGRARNDLNGDLPANARSASRTSWVAGRSHTPPAPVSVKGSDARPGGRIGSEGTDVDPEPDL
jgi:hypothetical protein